MVAVVVEAAGSPSSVAVDSGNPVGVVVVMLQLAVGFSAGVLVVFLYGPAGPVLELVVKGVTSVLVTT